MLMNKSIGGYIAMEKLRIALIGVGGMGSHHLYFYLLFVLATRGLRYISTIPFYYYLR